MVHNEDSRVKIPALCHLTRLGYTYLSLKGLTFDEETNIVFAFTKVDESELIIADE
ncbi:MAG: type I restriction enzyme R subunit, partial [Akkermansiaceae bacterium]